eukprot:m.24607 g.24607  ORF g.24607 m.24607 type:complete len:215 (+) comp14676_c0_seq1:71-715(+)
MATRRGALIVIEGCDRCGKSTQCARLVERLNAKKVPTQLLRFPDRTTAIGGMIDSYLRKDIELDDHVIHLLYSANRWESIEGIKKKLEAGTTLVIDRYAFSGVAFSSAKEGMDLDWCKQPDAGLPVPDLLLHLELSSVEAESRGGFGDERYEVTEFQTKVKSQFAKLYESLKNVQPVTLDVSGKGIEEVGALVEDLVNKELENTERKSSTLQLW